VTKQKEQFLLFRIRAFTDGKAFGELVQEHAPALQKSLTARLPRIQDAEDAFTEVSIRLWNYAQGTRIDSFLAVAFTISRSVIAEFYRTAEKKTDQQLTRDPAEINITVDSHKDLIDSVDSKILMELIRKLGDEKAEIIHMRYILGYRVKDIAEQIGKSEDAISQIIHRGLDQIKKNITEQFGKL
jgi:RNA polymerase sigma-70 factor (ECF subfamily)